MRRVLLALCALLVAGACFAVRASASCPDGEWPDYKPSWPMTAMTARTYLTFTAELAQEYIDDPEEPNAATWAKAKQAALDCIACGASHQHSTSECHGYWMKAKTAWQKAQNRDADACYTELNHVDPAPSVP